MLNSPWVKLAICAALVLAGWYARGVVADRDMLAYQKGQEKAAADQRDLKMRTDAKAAAVTAASSARLDEAAAKNQDKVQIVTKEVVKYVASPDHGKCVLPADWVRAYNDALFGVDAVPSAKAPGQPSTGAHP